MNEILGKLLKAAMHDDSLRRALINTRSAHDPAAAFCQCACEMGYPITVGELFSMGQEFNDTMLRSVNGGGVEGPDGWDDAYDMFFAALDEI
ncbi:MAG: hypothetical protein PUB37_08380 [Firmicutes bacterium]|nr:hypothetical protein [Bacillota bacterium]